MMNLTNDPWIPVIRADGTHDVLSLNEVFADAPQLRDLAVKPHERVALMRLLICITQAALDGPADEESWESCSPLIQSAAQAYLTRWSSSFELLGDGPRFLQIIPGILGPAHPVMEDEKISRLNLSLASGESNSIHFDNSATNDREFSAGQTALALLTYQCFCPLLGRGYKGKAPCCEVSMLHTLIIGENLLDSIHLNLLTQSDIEDAYGRIEGDRPSWEFQSASIFQGADHNALRLGYMARLVPLTRSVWIDSLARIRLANGLNYPSFSDARYREATATILQSADGLRPLSADLTRSVWRDLHTICVKNRSKADLASGPLAIRKLSAHQQFKIWCGALVSSEAKIKEIVESVYVIPVDMVKDFATRAAYESGVILSEQIEARLSNAVRAYSKALSVDKPPLAKARQQYWTVVELSLPTLFGLARNLTPKDALSKSEWGIAVQAAARDAYEQTCPCLTPRQIHAFALGLEQFFSANSSKSAKPNKQSSHE